MDLDALFILLQPWLRPFLAFVFLTFAKTLKFQHIYIFVILNYNKYQIYLGGKYGV